MNKSYEQYALVGVVHFFRWQWAKLMMGDLSSWGMEVSGVEKSLR